MAEFLNRGNISRISLLREEYFDDIKEAYMQDMLSCSVLHMQNFWCVQRHNKQLANYPGKSSDNHILSNAHVVMNIFLFLDI